MKVTQQRTQAAWHSTEEIFGKIDPQPEVQIKPLNWRVRNKMVEGHTRPVMVPHPDRPGAHLQAEQFDRLEYAVDTIHHSIVGLKHFEDENGDPIQPDADGIDFLLESLGAEFALWLQRLITQVSDEHDKIKTEKSDRARKNS
jgi:hypothetical protein